jgi:hypothetical protein
MRHEKIRFHRIEKGLRKGLINPRLTRCCGECVNDQIAAVSDTQRAMGFSHVTLKNLDLLAQTQARFTCHTINNLVSHTDEGIDIAHMRAVAFAQETRRHAKGRGISTNDIARQRLGCFRELS